MNAISTLKEHEKLILQKFGVKRIGIFGSFVLGVEREDSDLDVLVVFEEGQKTFDNYMDLKFYLEDLFGRKVALFIEKALKPQLKDIIMKDVVYA